MNGINIALLYKTKQSFLVPYWELPAETKDVIKEHDLQDNGQSYLLKGKKKQNYPYSADTSAIRTYKHKITRSESQTAK